LIVIGLAAQFYASQLSSKVSESSESVISIQKTHAGTLNVVDNFYRGEEGSEDFLIRHQNLLESKVKALNARVAIPQLDNKANNFSLSAIDREQAALKGITENWRGLSQLISNLLDASSELTTQNNLKQKLGESLTLMQSGVDDVAKALERESRLGNDVNKALSYVEKVAQVAEMKNMIASMLESKNDIGSTRRSPQILADSLDYDLDNFQASLKSLEASSELLTKTKLIDVQRQFVSLKGSVSQWQQSLGMLTSAHIFRESVDQGTQDFSQQLSGLRRIQESQARYQWLRGKSWLKELVTLSALSPEKVPVASSVVTMEELTESVFESTNKKTLTSEANDEEVNDELAESLDINSEENSHDSANDDDIEENKLIHQDTNSEQSVSTIKKLEQRVDSYQDTINHLETKLVEQKNEFETEQKSLIDEMIELRDNNDKLETSVSEFETKQSDASKNSEEIVLDLEAQIETQRSAIEQSELDLATLNKANEELQQETEDWQAKCETYTQEIEALSDNKELEEKDALLDKLNQEMKALQESTDSLREEFQQKEDSKQAEFEARLEADQDGYAAKLMELEAKLVKAKGHKESLQDVNNKYEELKERFDQLSNSSTENKLIENYASSIQGLTKGDFSISPQQEGVAALAGVSKVINHATSELKSMSTSISIAAEDVDDIKSTLNAADSEESRLPIESASKQLTQSLDRLDKAQRGAEDASTVFDKTSKACDTTLDITQNAANTLTRSQRKVSEINERLETIELSITKITEPLESLSDKTVNMKEVLNLIDGLSAKASARLRNAGLSQGDQQPLLRSNLEMTDSVNLASKKMAESIDQIRNDINQIAVQLSGNIESVEYIAQKSKRLGVEVKSFDSLNSQVNRLHQALKSRSNEEKGRIEALKESIKGSIDSIRTVVDVDLSVAQTNKQNTGSRQKVAAQLDELKKMLTSLV